MRLLHWLYINLFPIASLVRKFLWFVAIAHYLSSLTSSLIMSSCDISISSVILYVDVRCCLSNSFHASVISYCRRFNRNSLQSPISLLRNWAYLFINVEIHFCLGRLFVRPVSFFVCVSDGRTTLSSIRYSFSGVIPVGFRLSHVSIDLVLHALVQCDVLICLVEIYIFLFLNMLNVMGVSLSIYGIRLLVSVLVLFTHLLKYPLILKYYNFNITFSLIPFFIYLYFFSFP
jgi:hypothetical protein